MAAVATPNLADLPDVDTSAKAQNKVLVVDAAGSGGG